MYTKAIPYTDYNGLDRQEKFDFNLSKAEILEMEMSTEGGFAAKMQKIIETYDFTTLIREFKSLILKSYGVKSADGKRFIKSPELSKAFSETEAFSNLYVELATNTQSAIEFCNGIVPKEYTDSAEYKKELEEQRARYKNIAANIAVDSIKGTVASDPVSGITEETHGANVESTDVTANNIIGFPSAPTE